MKILFLDLDGTLLNDEKQITPGNQEALRAALEQGHRVVITTGRPLASAKIQSQRLGLMDPGCYIIAFNGGVIYDCGADKAIYENYLTAETALKAVRLCRRAGVHAQGYDATHVLVEPDHDKEAVEYYRSTTGTVFRQVESFHRELPAKVPKILAISMNDRGLLEQAETLIKTELAEETDCLYSSSRYMEIVAKGLNKGAAILRLCGLLGISVADSIAAGDQENDLSMIKTAGVGVAMANAIDAVKEAADYITKNDNNHDGIAEVVEKFLLNGQGDC